MRWASAMQMSSLPIDNEQRGGNFVHGPQAVEVFFQLA
jgi:hypothetical protein